MLRGFLNPLRDRFTKCIMEVSKRSRKEPIIYVVGCTGTGKSDLGVEIALKLGGEIISSDSMQIYKGLDIATNKITSEEARGVPHHMMSFVEPTSTAGFHVQHFREKTLQSIEEIRSRGKIPVIVGGTTYYVESILFENNFIDTPKSSDVDNSDLIDKNNQQLHDLLREIDPESAEKVHMNNRARVRRAIEVFRLTGSKKSEILKSQKNGTDTEFPEKLRFANSLVVFLDASIEVLDQRLDKRVGKMQTNGLREEVEEFYDENKEGIESGAFGVMQCIGLKEFVPYLRLPKEERRKNTGDALFTLGCEQVQLHTRQYSRKQRLWVRNRLIRRRGQRELPSVVRVDTSDPLTYLESGMKVVEEWMRGKDWEERDEGEVQNRDDANTLFKCELCRISVQGKECYERHITGKKHKGAERQKRRRETELQEAEDGETEKKRQRESSPKEELDHSNGSSTTATDDKK